MREHHISVMSLEEYEPNAEFVGRNFNAGEVIQLVLKARFTGHWLPFNYVQMVMQHELAHCKQMNHSKAFWTVRNQYAEQMRGLWSQNYTGEGIWGRGMLLGSGKFEQNTMAPGESLPEHLCGGTYRSRRRKRKARASLSYQEQKERRIRKKFGTNGVALGDDERSKLKLEGKWVPAKPRVAGSKRGRELRAAAALARLEQQKTEDASEQTRIKKEEDESTNGSETESDYDDESAVLGPEAVDINGNKLVDGEGHSMVKVCEDEEPDDQDVKRELWELQSSIRNRDAVEAGYDADAGTSQRESTTRGDRASGQTEEHKHTTTTIVKKESSAEPPRKRGQAPTYSAGQGSVSSESYGGGGGGPTAPCPLCSFANDRQSITCAMCSHVLDADSVPNSWHCRQPSCRDSIFLNAGDCGACGVCGHRRGS